MLVVKSYSAGKSLVTFLGFLSEKVSTDSLFTNIRQAIPAYRQNLFNFYVAEILILIFSRQTGFH